MSTGFDRPNIRCALLEKHRPLAQLLRFLDAHMGKAGIVPLGRGPSSRGQHADSLRHDRAPDTAGTGRARTPPLGKAAHLAEPYRAGVGAREPGPGHSKVWRRFLSQLSVGELERMSQDFVLLRTTLADQRNAGDS
jgi:hypothetical protein